MRLVVQLTRGVVLRSLVNPCPPLRGHYGEVVIKTTCDTVRPVGHSLIDKQLLVEGLQSQLWSMGERK